MSRDQLEEQRRLAGITERYEWIGEADLAALAREAKDIILKNALQADNRMQETKLANLLKKHGYPPRSVSDLLSVVELTVTLDPDRLKDVLS